MENNSTIFRETLIGFMAEEDPLPGMMKWMMDQLMKIEAGKIKRIAKELSIPFSGHGLLFCQFDMAMI